MNELFQTNDLLVIIYRYLSSFHDVCRLRTVSKTLNESFHEFINLQDYNDIFPRRTFISYGFCMACECASDCQVIVYTQDEFPKRVLVFCEKPGCFGSALKRLLHDSNRENVYPFAKWKQEEILIPRTSGGVSIGKVERCTSPIIKLDKKIGTLVVFEENIYEFDKLTLPKTKARALELRKFVAMEIVKSQIIDDSFLFSRYFNFLNL